jgi:hypothetical protein
MKALESNPGLSLFVRRRFLCWGRRQRPTRAELASGFAGASVGARGAKPLAGGGQGCERAPRVRSWSLPGIMKGLQEIAGPSFFIGILFVSEAKAATYSGSARDNFAGARGARGVAWAREQQTGQGCSFALSVRRALMAAKVPLASRSPTAAKAPYPGTKLPLIPREGRDSFLYAPSSPEYSCRRHRNPHPPSPVAPGAARHYR